MDNQNISSRLVVSRREERAPSSRFDSLRESSFDLQSGCDVTFLDVDDLPEELSSIIEHISAGMGELVDPSRSERDAVMACRFESDYPHQNWSK